MPEPHRHCQRINIVQPPEVKAEWVRAATAAGMSLSAWIEWACNAQLPESVQAKLPPRPQRGGNRRGKRDE